MVASTDRRRLEVAGVQRSPKVLLLMLGAAVGAGISPALADDAWTVTKPYPDNPLREASIAGKVHVGDSTEQSTLTIGCRADDDGAVMTASFVVPDTLDFQFGMFEGPGGVGEDEELLSVALQDTDPVTHNVSGWHSDDVEFTFSYLLPQDEASRWREHAGEELTMAVHLATAEDLPPAGLRAEFDLPEDARGLSDVIAPCLAATVINR
ncbi:hypothetical protein [Chelativorans sp. M5D2P16]|uniref:hypothetical protein n=1 Tax=Chelativorans sp. M5D2P16 TaxID=3095678 RepID=UPI002ACA05A5|nr:hypothetical protein [Chelativorans sp. M5D2P16]MDZ5698568.1 hypothetical protein [Chelativorans sp. M5D2P16]